MQELLIAPDNRSMITRNGHELQVDFDARRLPALKNGFGRKMDLSSARPETIGELPEYFEKDHPRTITPLLGRLR